MIFKIYLTNFDLVRAVLYVHLRNKFLWGLSIVVGMFFYALSFIGLWAMGFPLEETVLTSIGMLSWILMLNLVGFLCTCFGLLLNPGWRKGRIGEHSVQIAESGIIEETEFNKTEIRWPSISNVVVRAGLMFLPFAGNDIFVIPKRSFSSSEEWSTFVECINSSWNKSKIKGSD